MKLFKSILISLTVFILISSPVLALTTLYEHMDDYGNSVSYNNGNNIVAQTITVNTTHNMTALSFYLGRIGSPGTVYFQLNSINGTEPGASVLASGTTDGNTLPLSGAAYGWAGEWRTVTFSPSYSVNSTQMYSLILRTPDGDASNRVVYRHMASIGTYTGGGRWLSTNNGTSWYGYVDGDDLMFREYSESGELPTIVTGDANNITVDGARLYGNITDMGSDTTITTRGFYLLYNDTSRTTAYAGTFGTGEYYMDITGLPYNTEITYYAYCVNEEGLHAYGDPETFTTLVGNPIASALSSNVSGTSAQMNVSLTSSGGGGDINGITWYWRVKGGAQTYTWGESKTYEISTHSHTEHNLLTSTTYEWWARVENSGGGHVYTNTLEFTTGTNSIPTIITGTTDNRTSTSFDAVDNNLTSTGNQTVSILRIAYGYEPDELVNYSTSSGNFSTGLYDLSITNCSETLVYYQAQAYNPSGWATGIIRYVNLVTGQSGTTGSGSSGESEAQVYVESVQDSITGVMRIWGMNNTPGQMITTLIIMILVWFIFRNAKFLNILAPVLVFIIAVTIGWIPIWLIIFGSVIIGLAIAALLRGRIGYQAQ